MDQETKDRTVAALRQAGAVLPCPRCGNDRFALADEYTALMLQKTLGSIVIGGPVIPVAMTICLRCGFVAHHALGVIGLMPAGVASTAKSEDTPREGGAK